MRELAACVTHPPASPLVSLQESIKPFFASNFIYVSILPMLFLLLIQFSVSDFTAFWNAGCLSVNQSIDQSINQSTNPSTSQSASQSVS
jgi:hypothetical protein